MPFRFTIPRLLLVAAVFTAAFWLVKLLGLPWSILSRPSCRNSAFRYRVGGKRA